MSLSIAFPPPIMDWTMSNTYKVMEVAPKGDARPRYVSTQIGGNGEAPPFLFCNHHHKLLSKAERCRDFGMPVRR